MSEPSDADRRHTMWVSTFAPGPVGPIMRGTDGAAAVGRNNRLVWWLCALALIPIIGLLFAGLAILIAALDVVSGRERAWTALAIAAFAFAISAGMAAWIVS